ncbi:MAG: HlyD family secretion protein [Gemmatimonadales bacterium]
MDIPRAPVRKKRRLIYGGIGVAALAITTVALGSLKPAAPTVNRDIVLLDTVRQGSLLREVRGPGTLVPEQIRWISAVVAGRVEKRLVEPGQRVEPSTVLLELSNPDVQIQVLNAERQLTAAEAELVTLRTSLESQRLNQAATVASVNQQYREAKRNAEANEELARQGLISTNELKTAQDRADELTTRLQLEKDRLALFESTMEGQLRVQQEQVDRLRSIASFQRSMENSMVVRAGASGVVQELPLEVGQWANSGAVLAKVVQPGKLKAVLRIPETQAKDVQLGLSARIDTRNGIIPGHVVRIDPASVQSSVTMDIALDSTLPPGARPDLSVDGTIEIERLEDVVYMGRPTYGQPNSTVGIFKLEADGSHASRASVKLGRASVNAVEVVQGLKPGDVVILSDMSRWDAVDRVRLR